MSNVQTIPSRGFARGSIVRLNGSGPNMLVVRGFKDRTVVVVCEGHEDGTLRLREYDTGDLEQELATGSEEDAKFDLRWKADMRAIKMWQERTGKTLIWPDHADLCVWLLAELDTARRTAAEAMRERAAKVAETPDEDDDDLDRQTRHAAAAAIRSLEIEGDAK